MKQWGTSPFRAIVWKELRENLKWAALGCLLVSAALFTGINNILRASAAVDAGMLIIGSLSWKSVLTALIGFGMGLAQVMPENRGDRWGLLVHRPISRANLFWGKVTAGTLLYTSAVAAPLLLASLWVAQPGNIPIPFDWRMTLPGVADLLCGLVYYFAGILTGMRGDRFSRALVIGIGIVCSVLVVAVHTFQAAAACCAVGLLVAGTAAWGAFISGGQYEAQPLRSRAATALAKASGLVVLGFVLVIIVSYLLTNRTGDATRSRNYALTSDGTVVQVVQDRLWGNTLEVIDLRGRPLEKYKDLSVRKMAAGVVWASTTFNPEGHRRQELSWQSGYRTANSIFTQLPPPAGEVRWYYIKNRGLAVEYDGRSSSRIIGWLGPDGFTAGEEPPAQHFNGPLQSIAFAGPPMLAFADGVYRLDLEHRVTEKIFTAPAGESILGAGGSIYSYGVNPLLFAAPQTFDVVATTKRVYVQTLAGKTLLTVPYDPLAADYGELQVARIPEAPGSPTFVWYVAENGDFPVQKAMGMPLQVTQYNGDGSVAGHLTLPREAFKEVVRTGSIAASSLVMPVTARAVLEFKQWFTGNKVFLGEFAPDTAIPGWVLAIAISLFASLFAFMRGRSFAFARSRLWLWTGLAFALGPLGYVLMRVLLAWPAKANCASCQRLRIVTREKCEHCNASFSEPEMDGTEIFETVTT